MQDYIKFILLFSPTEIALSEIFFKLVEKILIFEPAVSIASPPTFSYELFTISPLLKSLSKASDLEL